MAGAGIALLVEKREQHREPDDHRHDQRGHRQNASHDVTIENVHAGLNAAGDGGARLRKRASHAGTCVIRSTVSTTTTWVHHSPSTAGRAPRSMAPRP